MPRAGVQVVGWQNVAIPEQRLRFWSEPEVEVDLAAATGIGILRLGVDWGRIVPTRPPLVTMGASATLSVCHVPLALLPWEAVLASAPHAGTPQWTRKLSPAFACCL